MTEVLLLHHACGCTDGVAAFADRLAAAGHTVHTPDLYDGRTFATVEEGVGHARSLGDTLDEQAVAAADALPSEVVQMGWSLGVMNAQQFAQNRAGARGAVLLEAFVAPHHFGAWPAGLPAQIHGMADDPFFAGDGDLAAAEEFAAATEGAEVFTYPGSGHLAFDSSLPSYDEGATALVVERVIGFLDSR